MAAEIDPENMPFSLAPLGPRGSQRVTENLVKAMQLEPVKVPLLQQPASNTEKREMARAFALQISSAINRSTGKTIRFSVGGLKHFAAYSGDQLKWSLLPKLSVLVERAEYVASEAPDKRKASDKNLRAYHKMALPVDVDGNERLVKITVQEDGNGEWFYDASPLEIAWPADGSTGPTSLAGLRLPDIQRAAESIARSAFGVKNEGSTAQDQETAFSLAPRSLAAVADTVLAAKMRKPEFREKYLEIARQRLDKLRQDGEWRVSNWGQVSQRVGTDTLAARIRTPANIEAERKFRQRSRQRELIEAGMAGLTPETLAAYETDLTSLEDHPLVAAMLEGQGRLMSRTTALRLGKLKTDGTGNAGDDDGAPPGCESGPPTAGGFMTGVFLKLKRLLTAPRAARGRPRKPKLGNATFNRRV